MEKTDYYQLSLWSKQDRILMDDFNAVFDRITQAYFEPEKFFGFMDEYRDADGVVQLSPESISEFYGRSMALLTDVKSDFERRFAEL